MRGCVVNGYDAILNFSWGILAAEKEEWRRFEPLIRGVMHTNVIREGGDFSNKIYIRPVSTVCVCSNSNSLPKITPRALK